MARPIKDGVDYFPKDTDFYYDDKVKLLRSYTGVKGMYILDFILCELYRTNGYFLKWDNDRCFLMAEAVGCGCRPEHISEVISVCLKVGLFDKSVFDSDGVITSAGIQRRYLRMLNSRENIELIEEYWLLDMSNKKDVPAGILKKVAFKSVSFKENPDKTKGNPFKTKGNAQSKVNYSKVKYSSGNPPPTIEEINSFIKENGLTKVSGSVFYSHYSKREWKTVKGKDITDWQTLLLRWNNTEYSKGMTKGDYSTHDIDLFEQMLDGKD